MINFILSECLSEDKTEEYKRAIEKIGAKCTSLKYAPFETLDLYSLFPKDSCVVTFGTLNLVRDILKKTNWVPGAWCNFENFKCSTYYAYWHKFLWNTDSEFLTWGQIKDDPDLRGVAFFVRPDDGFKSFTGQLIKGDYDLRHIDSLVKPHTLCIVSKPHQPRHEYRVFCRGKNIITGSQYRSWGKLDPSRQDTESGLLLDVESYAWKVLSEVKWIPEELFVMDIGDGSDGSMGVIELNSFSCSGVYECNIEKIVKAAAEVAEEEWKDIYGEI